MVLLFHNSSHRESEKIKNKNIFFFTEFLTLQNFRITIFVFQDFYLCSAIDLDIAVCAVTYV